MPNEPVPGAIPAALDDLAMLDPTNLAALIRDSIASNKGHLTDGQRPRVEHGGRSAAPGAAGA